MRVMMVLLTNKKWICIIKPYEQLCPDEQFQMAV